MTYHLTGVIQARLGSSRLPRKVLETVAGKTILERMMDNLRLVDELDDVVLAIPASDVRLAEVAEARGWDWVSGSEHDVLGRFVETIRGRPTTSVLRMTADCPLLDPGIVGAVATAQRARPADYRFIEGYPRGVGDVEAISVDALLRMDREARSAHDREHVMTYIIDHQDSFECAFDEAPELVRRPELRVCVDTVEDLQAVRLLLSALGDPSGPIDAYDVVRALDTHPHIRRVNRDVQQRT